MSRNWTGAGVALVLMGVCGLAVAQGATQSRTVKPSHFDQSQPLRAMSHLSPLMQSVLHNGKASAGQVSQMRQKLEQAGYLPTAGSAKQIPLYTKKPANTAVGPVRDSEVQSSMGDGGTRSLGAAVPDAFTSNAFTTPSLSFDALGGSTGYIPNVFPPDPNAAVGYKYVVETVNLAFGIFNKTTGARVLGPVKINALWAGFGGPCQSDNDGDPIVMFDQLSQRWVITQFAIGATHLAPPFYQCIAVSTSSDPTGSYYRYAYKISDTLMNDYPKFGVWPDAYYYTANLFNASTGQFVGVAFGAFDRAQMVAGNPYAPMVLFDVPLGSGEGAYSVMPATLDGYTLPPSGAPGIFVDYISPRLWGASGYALQMWRMHVDWNTPTNSTLSAPTQITVPAFNDLVCNGNRACIPQPNVYAKLDAISDRLMYRLAYRNLGSEQALVVNQTVAPYGTSTTVNPPTAPRWYELTAPVAATSAFSLAQSGTFAPGTSTTSGPSRWMGSIAMDHQGDLALGYSLSSSTIAPSIAYTGQVVGTTPGQMSEPETILKAGGGEQTAYGFRWGDYTSMATDPSNECTFWYTNEYYNSTGSADWSTHIGAFQFPSCVPETLGTLSGMVTDASTGLPVPGADVVINPGDIITQTNASGQYSMQLSAGSYTAQAISYPEMSATASVAITAGQAQSQDFSLQATSKVTISGNVLDGGLGNGTPAHGWGLYANLKVMVPNVGQVAEVFTNPVTGAYSVQVPKGFAYTLRVQAHSNYLPTEADLGTVAQNTTHNFTLLADAACNAPGYGDNFSEDFNASTFPPFGWAVTNAVSGSPVVWNTNVAWQDGNYTGGTGMAATADSNMAYVLDGYSGVYDTSLISQPIAVSGLSANPVLNFLLNYQEFSGNDALDVEINVDGTGWTTMAHITSNYGALYGGYFGNQGGASYTIDMSQYIPSGAKSIQLRWRYYDPAGGFDWYAQVDDVTIGTCQMLPGGLVVGQVSNLESQLPVAGARVYDELFDSTDNFATSKDPNFNDLYILYVPTGRHTVMASGDSLFGSTTMDIAANAVARQDFQLGNADLMVSKATGEAVTQGARVNVANVVVSNQGPDTAVGATLTVSTTGGLLQMESATPTQGSCSLSRGNEIICDLGDIAADRSVSINVTAYAIYVGQATLTVATQAQDNDPNPSNNTTNTVVTIQDPPSPSAGGSGGGGSFGITMLLILLGLAGLGAGLRYRRQRGGAYAYENHKEEAMSQGIHSMPRGRQAGWTLGVAIFLAVVLGVTGTPASAAPSHRAQGLMRAPAALVSAVAKNEARTVAHETAYHINAHGCAGAGQALRACFDPGASARFTAAKTAGVRLHFTAWGRNGALAPVHLQAGQATGNRIAYRGAGIKAWWRALPIGYEQGFTVTRAPAGAGKLVLELTASAPAKVHQGVLSWGQVHYGKLYVSDAEGHQVPARLSAHGHTVLIRIADAGAHYPLNIDPLTWVTQRESAPSPATAPEVGGAVVLSRSGALALVGGSNHVYVYTKSNGAWSLQTELVPQGTGLIIGQFGSSMALSADGTIALIGSPSSTSGGYLQGRAFAFQNVNGTWTQTAILHAPLNAFGRIPGFAKFGVAVALNGAGNEALIGASFLSQPFRFLEGSAFIYRETNGTWSETAQFWPTGNVNLAVFGAEVAMDATGNEAIVSAEEQNINGLGSATGAVYIYNYAGGAWSSATQLLASDSAGGHAFGSSLSVNPAGDALLVGAYSYPGYIANYGKGYVFTKSNGTWQQTGQLLASDPGTFDELNNGAISDSGNTVVMGAALHNPIGANFYLAEGAAYVFSNLNGTWTQTAELEPLGKSTAWMTKLANFGWSVAMSGSHLLIGGPRFYANYENHHPGPGAAYFMTPSNLSLVLNAPAQVSASGQYTSQAILTNSSASSSAPLTLAMPLPAGVGYVSATPTQGSCSQTSAAVSCALGQVAGNGGSASVTLTLTAPATVGTIKNQVLLANTSPTMNVIKDTAVGPDPSVSGLTNLNLKPSQGGTETFRINGGTGPLTVMAHSSNQTLLPDANISGAGSCTAPNMCTLSIDPMAQQSGNADVTVTVTDSSGASGTGSFTVSVAAPSAPTSSGSGGGASSPLGLFVLVGLLGFAGLRRRLIQRRG